MLFVTRALERFCWNVLLQMKSLCDIIVIHVYIDKPDFGAVA